MGAPGACARARAADEGPEAAGLCALEDGGAAAET
eukprot:gene11485-4427_t